MNLQLKINANAAEMTKMIDKLKSLPLDTNNNKKSTEEIINTMCGVQNSFVKSSDVPWLTDLYRGYEPFRKHVDKYGMDEKFYKKMLEKRYS